jgi:hypothetical protein
MSGLGADQGNRANGPVVALRSTREPGKASPIRGGEARRYQRLVSVAEVRLRPSGGGHPFRASPTGGGCCRGGSAGPILARPDGPDSAHQPAATPEQEQIVMRSAIMLISAATPEERAYITLTLPVK